MNSEPTTKKTDEYKTKDSSQKQEARQRNKVHKILNLFQGFAKSSSQNSKDVEKEGKQIKFVQASQQQLDINVQTLHKVEDTQKAQEIQMMELAKLFPYEINEIIVEIAQADLDYGSDQDQEGEKQIKRQKQSVCMFILLIIFSLITAIQNLYIFLGELPYRDIMVTFPTVLMRVIIFPIITYKMCNNWQVLLRLTFMVDKILLSAILAYIGVMGFILIFIPYTPSAWMYQSLFILYPLVWLFYIGNFRVMMVYCEWSKVQVIIYKLTLLIGSTSYFVLGVYYLVGKLRFTRGLRPELDQSIENLLLIYINAGFQVYLELIARMDSIDGCSNFKINYKLFCDPQNMQALLKGRKIDKNQQNQENSDSDSDSLSDPTDTEDRSEQLFKKVLSQIQQDSLNPDESILQMEESSRKLKSRKINNKLRTIDFSEDQQMQNKDNDHITNQKVQHQKQNDQYSESVLNLSGSEKDESIQKKQEQKFRKRTKVQRNRLNLQDLSFQPEINRNDDL